MPSTRLNLVVAMCNSRGIGINGKIPWRLRKDMEVFKKITTETKDPDKNNVVIMGKKTWLSIPEKFRPLPKRINIVLSRNMIETPSGAYLARSFKEAVAMVTGKGDFAEKVENVYIIGGSSVYKEAMDFQWPCRIYLTRVLADYDCDTYLPEFDLNKFKKLQHCEDVPAIRMTENGVEFEFEVYDKCVTKASEMSFNVMAAMCSNRGIGMANKLPWPSLSAEISGDPYVHKVVASLDEALEYVSITLHDQVETVWVMGGQSIYTDAVNHPQCNKIYLTHIYGEYEADTFFPPFEGRFHEDKSVALDRTLQEERGVTYKYKVYCPRHQASC
ncbi:dihydrofolate reductase-like isoform X3 [Ylistrum balloti]|uniref:dihydrofolate reductase-like isoform X3 n=1 Tax=Ylistrum balloti TaxID=509963 RepID=UPI002905D449|nr:dihydrofolate reductase-like isoform X3 [Ylistrum balloti]